MTHCRLSLAQAISDFLFSQHEQNQYVCAPGSLLPFGYCTSASLASRARIAPEVENIVVPQHSRKCDGFLASLTPCLRPAIGVAKHCSSPSWHRRLRQRRSSVRKGLLCGRLPSRAGAARLICHHSTCWQQVRCLARLMGKGGNGRGKWPDSWASQHGSYSLWKGTWPKKTAEKDWDPKIQFPRYDEKRAGKGGNNPSSGSRGEEDGASERALCRASRSVSTWRGRPR